VASLAVLVRSAAQAERVALVDAAEDSQKLDWERSGNDPVFIPAPGRDIRPHRPLCGDARHISPRWGFGRRWRIGSPGRAGSRRSVRPGTTSRPQLPACAS